MLSRFDDKAIDNAKIEQAADELDGVREGGKPGRRFGYTRAYGAWSWGVTYANAHLTDGLLTNRAIEKYRIGAQECAALVSVGAWDVVAGGFQIHDFLDWNPSAAQVKAKQSKDRDRKRKAAGYVAESAVDSARNPDGVAADSFASRAEARAPAGLGRAGLGTDQPTSSDDQGEREREPAAPLAVVHPGQFALSKGQIAASGGGLVGAWNNVVAGSKPFVPVPPTVADHHDVLAALRRQPSIDWWTEVCVKVAGSDFLRGLVALSDGRTFVADFWWVLDRAEQIHAGRYDNRASAPPALPPSRSQQRRAKNAASTAAVIASFQVEEPVS